MLFEGEYLTWALPADGNEKDLKTWRLLEYLIDSIFFLIGNTFVKESVMLFKDRLLSKCKPEEQ